MQYFRGPEIYARNRASTIQLNHLQQIIGVNFLDSKYAGINELLMIGESVPQTIHWYSELYYLESKEKSELLYLESKLYYRKTSYIAKMIMDRILIMQPILTTRTKFLNEDISIPLVAENEYRLEIGNLTTHTMRNRIIPLVESKEKGRFLIETTKGIRELNMGSIDDKITLHQYDKDNKFIKELNKLDLMLNNKIRI